MSQSIYAAWCNVLDGIRSQFSIWFGAQEDVECSVGRSHAWVLWSGLLLLVVPLAGCDRDGYLKLFGYDRAKLLGMMVRKRVKLWLGTTSRTSSSKIFS
ncbi:MAG TPA: hypothetical protein VN946_13905 [Terriglobales bacterium]|jgi:hypothetical protein|nr:hypothetical protein [Terriglobales bacterium]